MLASYKILTKVNTKVITHDLESIKTNLVLFFFFIYDEIMVNKRVGAHFVDRSISLSYGPNFGDAVTRCGWASVYLHLNIKGTILPFFIKLEEYHNLKYTHALHRNVKL